MKDFFFYSESCPDINFYSDISPLETKYFNPNKIFKGFERLCKNGFSVLNVNIKSINKNSETFKLFYSILTCMFTMIYFWETWATDNSICNDLNVQIKNYTILHQIRESGRGWGLSIFVQKKFTLSHIQVYP